MTEGETIHTENSLKYGARDVCVLLRAGGWSPVATWTDREELFTVILAGDPNAQTEQACKVSEDGRRHERL